MSRHIIIVQLSKQDGQLYVHDPIRPHRAEAGLVAMMTMLGTPLQEIAEQEADYIFRHNKPLRKYDDDGLKIYLLQDGEIAEQVDIWRSEWKKGGKQHDKRRTTQTLRRACI